MLFRMLTGGMWILEKFSARGFGWQKTEWQIWGEVPVYFQILRNQDCNEQESVLSREAA